MELKSIFTRFDIYEETEKRRVAYVLAWFGCLKDCDNENVSEVDIEYYDLEELEQITVSEYDFESGAYLNGVWLSLKNIVSALSSFQN